MIPTVAYGSDTWNADVSKALKEFGVVIVSGVLSDTESDEYMSKLVNDFFRKINPKLAKQEAWVEENLPHGPRVGMFQSLVGQIKPVWDLRSDTRVRSVFTEAYSGIREEKIDEFVSSHDGINVHPPIGPYFDESTSLDWAHVDQSKRKDPFRCVQGQVVLTNTSACFRCSPKSHTVFEELLDYVKCVEGPKATRQFVKFKETEVPGLKEIVERAGGAWQVPVRAKKGSMILWLSTTVHSAQLQRFGAKIDRSDKWSEWRGVVYICFRPKHEISDEQFALLKDSFEKNLCTNHWGENTFATGSAKAVASRDPSVGRFLSDPAALFEAYPELKTPVSAEVKRLLLKD